MKTQQEIEEAIDKIINNNDLTYGYREDVEMILNWVLDKGSFDGI